MINISENIILTKNCLRLMGRQFNKLFVLYPVISRSKTWDVLWMCECDCGKLTLVKATDIKSGKIKSCGCLLLEINKTRILKGKNNPRYIDGRSHKDHYCIKCRKNKISIGNFFSGKQQCKECYKKTLSGLNNPNYKHGKTYNNKCINCNCKISENAIRCVECAGKQTSIRQKGRNNPMWGKTRKHGKGGRYKDIWMKSSYEIKYAIWLDKNRIPWQYEPKAFDLGNTTYTPDFYLPESDEWIEIKGRWHEDAKEKFDKFSKLYKSLTIVVLDTKYLKQKNII
jgi:hypothetical protein